ncbi:MAG: zinc finger domain-containing protein, partial [Pseudomonadota bacterium]
AHGLSVERVAAWQDVIQVRGLVNKEIEVKRGQGLVGSSLQSEIDVYADAKLYTSLASLQDDLRFVLITSRAAVHEQAGETSIEVTPSNYVKCERCWHYRADVGAHAEHPTICGRCVSNLFGAGEPRTYA